MEQSTGKGVWTIYLRSLSITYLLYQVILLCNPLISRLNLIHGFKYSEICTYLHMWHTLWFINGNKDEEMCKYIKEKKDECIARKRNET